MHVIITLYCISPPQINPLLLLLTVCQNWADETNMLQLGALSICDASLKDSYLIRKAAEALKQCDTEQKIHLKGTQERKKKTLNKIFASMCQDQACRKWHAYKFHCAKFLITFGISASFIYHFDIVGLTLSLQFNGKCEFCANEDVTELKL